MTDRPPAPPRPKCRYCGSDKADRMGMFVSEHNEPCPRPVGKTITYERLNCAFGPECKWHKNHASNSSKDRRLALEAYDQHLEARHNVKVQRLVW